MANATTQSGARVSPVDVGARPSDKQQKTRPEKPNEQQYNEDLAKAEKEHAAVQEKLNAIKAKIDAAQPQNKDSPTARRQQELKSELQSIKQKQSAFKSSRGSLQEKISVLDAQLKSRMAEQKIARSRVAFKSVEEIDREIQRLEKQVDAGTMKLVDEKKALAEISSLRKQRKGFAGFDEAEKGIQDVKTQIAELRRTIDNPEVKALNQKYDEINQDLQSIKAEQDKAYGSLNSLRDERSKLHAEQQEKYSAVRSIKDKYRKAWTVYRDYEQEQNRQRQERQRTEREQYQKQKRREIAAKKLEEASEPAFMDEILTAEGLIRYFEPSSLTEASKSLRGPSGFAAEAQRSVDSFEFKGVRVAKKEDRDDNYFMGGGGKKGKKGKKGSSTTGSPAPSTPTEGKFNLTVGVIEELAKINVEPPMNQAGVPVVVEKLKQKRDQWKADQDKKTRENIEKAQREIDRLEAEAIEMPQSGSRRAHDSSKKPAAINQSVSGTASAQAELEQEKDASADVTEDLKKAGISDIVEN
ncbi:MAG: hypothetical protein Q9191_001558 [Dirinaria sp. TL-2023a]